MAASLSKPYIDISQSGRLTPEYAIRWDSEMAVPPLSKSYIWDIRNQVAGSWICHSLRFRNGGSLSKPYIWDITNRMAASWICCSLRFQNGGGAHSFSLQTAKIKVSLLSEGILSFSIVQEFWRFCKGENQQGPHSVWGRKFPLRSGLPAEGEAASFPLKCLE